MKKSILSFLLLSSFVVLMGTTEQVSAAESGMDITDNSIQSMTVQLDENNNIISQEIERKEPAIQTFGEQYYDNGSTYWKYSTWFNAQGKKTGYSGLHSNKRAHWSKSSIGGGNSQTGRAKWGWSNANSQGPRTGTHYASWGWS